MFLFSFVSANEVGRGCHNPYLEKGGNLYSNVNDESRKGVSSKDIDVVLLEYPDTHHQKS